MLFACGFVAVNAEEIVSSLLFPEFPPKCAFWALLVIFLGLSPESGNFSDSGGSVQLRSCPSGDAFRRRTRGSEDVPCPLVNIHLVFRAVVLGSSC